VSSLPSRRWRRRDPADVAFVRDGAVIPTTGAMWPPAATIPHTGGVYRRTLLFDAYTGPTLNYGLAEYQWEPA
jgi:hypothetical protein